MTFDSKITFELVARASYQRLGFFRKSWQVFYDPLLFGRCFWDFVLPIFEYCSAVWCLTANTHLKLLDRVVSGASFLTGSVFESDLIHHRSVAVLCMLYKTRFNMMHSLYGAIDVPYVLVHVKAHGHYVILSALCCCNCTSTPTLMLILSLLNSYYASWRR